MYPTTAEFAYFPNIIKHFIYIILYIYKHTHTHANTETYHNVWHAPEPGLEDNLWS